MRPFSYHDDAWFRIAAVLHAENFGPGFDFPAELANQEAFWEAYALHYRLWLFDLNAGTAPPVRGLPDATPRPPAPTASSRAGPS